MESVIDCVTNPTSGQCLHQQTTQQKQHLQDHDTPTSGGPSLFILFSTVIHLGLMIFLVVDYYARKQRDKNRNGGQVPSAPSQPVSQPPTENGNSNGNRPPLNIVTQKNTAQPTTADDVKREVHQTLRDIEMLNEKKYRLFQQLADFEDTPPSWTDVGQVLVEVPPNEDEYWGIQDRLRSTCVPSSNASNSSSGHELHVSKIWRVENKVLWAFYKFQKERLMDSGKLKDKERSVWFGTGHVEPAMFYNDQKNCFGGFNMKFARDGILGRGMYFSEHSSYADRHAYNPKNTPAPWLEDNLRDESLVTKEGMGDDREIFLTKLFVGKEMRLDDVDFSVDDDPQDTTVSSMRIAIAASDEFILTEPETKLRYNTLSGFDGDKRVWMVFDDDGAVYPEYLVRYYQGQRDTRRTPFRNFREALMGQSLDDDASGEMVQIPRMVETNQLDDDEFVGPPTVVAEPEPLPVVYEVATWGYLDDDNQWRAYSEEDQSGIEWIYRRYQEHPQLADSKFRLHVGTAVYELDVREMTQTRVNHSAHTKRRIRRSVRRDSVAAATGAAAAPAPPVAAARGLR